MTYPRLFICTVLSAYISTAPTAATCMLLPARQRISLGDVLHCALKSIQVARELPLFMGIHTHDRETL